MKKTITFKYLKEYLSLYFWKLREVVHTNPDYPDYSSILFKSELDKQLSEMQKVLFFAHDMKEVKEALRYILNALNFDYAAFLKESTNIILQGQEEARELFLYIWDFIYEEDWRYPDNVNIKRDIILKDNMIKKIDVSKIISQKKWHDKKEKITWDTQILFNKDGTGVLSYIHPQKQNKILLGFRYRIMENNYSSNTLIMLHFPDLNLAFELTIKVTKARKKLTNSSNGNGKRNGHNTIIKLSDNPYFLTQDYLHRKNHIPQETFFYQYAEKK